MDDLRIKKHSPMKYEKPQLIDLCSTESLVEGKPTVCKWGAFGGAYCGWGTVA